MNIYPYNVYILYAACAALLITLISAVPVVLKLKKTVDEKMPVINHMQEQIELASIKASAVQEKKAEDRKKNRIYKIALPVLLAVYESYRRNAEANGLHGVAASVKHITTDERERTKLIRKIRKAL